jgi:hypothetical protein
MDQDTDAEKTVGGYLQQVESTHADTKSDRDMLRGKLRGYLKDLDLSAVPAKGMEATMIAVDIFNKLLKDTDGQSETLAKLHIANKKADQADASANLVAAYIKQLHVNQTPMYSTDAPDDSDARIDTVFNEKCTPIKDTELL